MEKAPVVRAMPMSSGRRRQSSTTGRAWLGLSRRRRLLARRQRDLDRNGRTLRHRNRRDPLEPALSVGSDLHCPYRHVELRIPMRVGLHHRADAPGDRPRHAADRCEGSADGRAVRTEHGDEDAAPAAQRERDVGRARGHARPQGEEAQLGLRDMVAPPQPGAATSLVAAPTRSPPTPWPRASTTRPRIDIPRVRATRTSLTPDSATVRLIVSPLKPSARAESLYSPGSTSRRKRPSAPVMPIDGMPNRALGSGRTEVAETPAFAIGWSVSRSTTTPAMLAAGSAMSKA